MPRLARHAPAAKLRLTARLPRGPGVYVLRDAQGTPLAVEAAADVRRAVRDLFGTDPARGVRHLLRTVHAVDHEPCASTDEAARRAAVLAEQLLPPRRRRARRRDAEPGLRCAAC